MLFGANLDKQSTIVNFIANSNKGVRLISPVTIVTGRVTSLPAEKKKTDLSFLNTWTLAEIRVETAE